MDDRTQFRKDMNAELGEPFDGVTKAELHRDAREVVRYVTMDPGAVLDLDDAGGIEVLVLDGGMSEKDDVLSKGSWLRLPEGTPLSGTAGSEGAKIWIKTGHLPFAKPPLL